MLVNSHQFNSEEVKETAPRSTTMQRHSSSTKLNLVPIYLGNQIGKLAESTTQLTSETGAFELLVTIMNDPNHHKA